MNETLTERHRHLIEKEGMEKLLKDPSTPPYDRQLALLRLRVINGIINLASEIRDNHPICYEDACSLIVDMI